MDRFRINIQLTKMDLLKKTFVTKFPTEDHFETVSSFSQPSLSLDLSPCGLHEIPRG